MYYNLLKQHQFTKHKPYYNNDKVSKDNKSKKFSCKICDKEFSSQYSYAGHMNAHTKLKQIRDKGHRANYKSPCPIPESIHNNTSQNVTNMLFDDCDRIFRRSSDLYSHIRDIHDGCPFKCELCNREFKYHRDLRSHKSNNHDSELTKQKNNVSDEEKDINDDNGDQEEEEEEQEEDIDMDFNSEEEYEEEEDENEEDTDLELSSEEEYDEGSLKCQWCRHPFTCYEGLKEHELLHFAKKNFICPYCNKGFILEHRWSQHIINVEKKEPFKCYTCGDLSTERRFK